MTETSLAPTEPRMRFLAALSLGDVEQRFTKDKYPYWVMIDRATTRATRCDSMIMRLIDAGWLTRHAGYIDLTSVGRHMLKEHGAEQLSKRRLSSPAQASA